MHDSDTPCHDSPSSGQDEFRRPESVLIVVHTYQQVLLLERVSPKGYWQSVTGSLEWNESTADCARRELFEETGLKAEPLDTGQVNQFEIMPHWRSRYAEGIEVNTEYVFHLPLQQAVIPVLSAEEHCGYQWLDAREAAARCFSHTNAEAIEHLLLSHST